ncbi:pentatricopeptide repeat-containing protein At3g02330, mitochondrial isoform X1 [Arachis duranensis]|uniref:Pentatricopeptide repeat-containing protein At3g02330, mitochondrial isoform X1 n=2 Tax=Arachis duranensis TaxID=130453 RepID=A0A6P5NP74_ARADU|nr:pentatricopeptide repeat-containing protein At3g02330, mitochondrial isoform X1 [Arachis duranensis]XP_020996871.1 pentatricopeptide repeat-containing protein At3g02330, mitochondrial isoform X1 [Arachis duranensis]XP_020996874.1 pentatricopeptide repeat-containing protein At3g02330, mitochondrial isoform X1 [Arachis duranensis]XP_020996878.1 pentatricopeptide repeat-containing protein At3g02330, mitochondrial isoform X1 [Arachis duranensis]XP_052116872.1 pentatricopeptide repeat-containing 
MNPTKKLTFSHIFQRCSSLRALNPGKQAHAQMIVTAFVPSIYVTNCLLQFYCKCSNMAYAFNVFDRMPQRDIISWNTMLFGYAGVGNVGFAQYLFDSMPERDVVSWNSMLSCYLQNGTNRKTIDIFIRMRSLRIPHDYATFAVVLKACLGIGDYCLGLQVHCVAIRMGFDNDVVTASALVDMYSKCKKLDNALQVFYEMPERNLVCWSAVIAACVQNDQFIEGLKLFKDTLKAGIGVSQSTYASAFRSCAGLAAFKLGTQLHGHALKFNFGYDTIVGTATLDMYSKCNRMSDARKLFNSLPNPTRQSYNAIIVGYARQDQGLKALENFQSLQRSHLGLDEISLSGALTACAAIKGRLEGIQLHGLAFKCGLTFDICVANAILDMYGKCGGLLEACVIFDEMERRDAVSWNAIIAAHEQNEGIEKTLSLFVSMLRSTMEPDDFTYGSVVKTCAGQQALNYGMEIHGQIIKSGLGLDSFVGSSLVDMYCKCGMLEEAEKIHYRLEGQTTASWNSMLSGFSSQKQSENAQKHFSQMLEMGVIPDNFTYATVLDICANLATVELGKQIHAQILKLQLHSDVYIASTLVDMYSKCGNMQDSRLMFEKAPKKDYVTWSAMICAYAYHGLGEEAIKLFEDMQLFNVKPNHTIFISVLRACAHMGYVDRGLHYFQKMQNYYGLDPRMEHYSCMVDLLGRSEQVNEALKLIQSMPFEADDVIWRTLLSNCKMQGNIEVAEAAASSLLQLDPQDSSAYVLLSNFYAIVGMWGEVAKIRNIMKNYKLKKEPGCSWIEVRNEVHAFLVGDKAHPRSEEIYEQTRLLVDEMKWDGYVPEIDFMVDEEPEEQDSYEGLTVTEQQLVVV